MTFKVERIKMEHAKRLATAKGEFEALMLGDIGIVHDKVVELNSKIEAFNESLPKLTSGAVEVLGVYDIRAERLYAELLDANAEIQKSTEAISQAAGHGVEALRENMASVTKEVVKTGEVMLAVQRAVSGENGLTDHLKAVESSFGDKLWILDKGINALSTIQISKLAQHEKAISALKTVIVAAVAFCAGAGVSSNPWLGAIGVGVLAVGVFAGWLFGLLFSKKPQ
jgi:hypothetical protein